MQIGGLQKTTLVDFPGTVAATVFTQGCPFRCHFCHNPELVLKDKFNPTIKEKDILDFLHERLGKLGGVCITGGEPLMQKDIDKFISHIKAIGFKVKLDTNGYYPDRLASIIKSGDVDYIAMDIKSPLDKYPSVANIEIRNPKSETNPNVLNPKSEKDTSNFKTSQLQNPIQRSISLIMRSKIDYEFRTTVAKPLISVDDVLKIGKMIKGAKKYYIQNYVKTKQINEEMKLKPFSNKELKEIVERLKKDIDLVRIR